MSTEKISSIESLVQEGLDRVIDEGIGLVSLTFRDAGIIGRLAAEANSTKVLNVSPRHGKKDGWQHMRRARFFPDSDYREPDFLRRCGSRLLRSSLWVPEMDKFARQVAVGVQRAGGTHGVKSWREWKVNRIGVNFAEGSPKSPAVIARHTDVKEELGLVAVLELVRGRSDTPSISTDNFTLIVGAEVCDERGMVQAPHGDEPIYDWRTSMTLADLRLG